MNYVILGFLIVYVIGFFVVVWKASPEWRWFHIVSVVLIILLSVTLIFPVAGALKSRSEWHKVKEELEARAERAHRELRAIKYGDASSGDSDEGLIALSQRLAKINAEAGRTWRGLRMQNNSLTGIVLVRPQPQDAGMPDDIPPAADAEGGAAAVPAEALPLVTPGAVVYGFAEQDFPGAPAPIPSFYLGEYRASTSTPTEVTLVPTGKLKPAQQQAIASRQATRWSLYELLPLDGHDMFVTEGSIGSDEELFGRVDEELLRQIFGNRLSEPALQRYLRDGKQALADDPPLARWTKVRFTKRHEIEVDSPDKFGATDGGFFDGSGRAVDSRLQREEGNVVVFNVDDEIVVKEEAARQLFDQDVARLVDTYYVRPLNDYRYVLRRIRLELDHLEIRKQEIETETQLITDAITATESMLTTNQEIKLKLEQDYAQVQIEKNSISEYHDRLATEVKETRETLVRLYRSNQQLERELHQIHTGIENRIDSITMSP